VLGHRGDGRLAVVVHHPGVAGGREDQRHRETLPEQLHAGVGIRDRSQGIRVERDPPVGRHVAGRRDLLLRRAVDVVEDRAGRRALRRRPEIAHGERTLEAPGGPAEPWSTELDDVAQLGPPRQLAHGPDRRQRHLPGHVRRSRALR
jgi:hypothetical protein